MDISYRKIQRRANYDENARKQLEHMSNQKLAGPYSHLINEWSVFIDDNSHYQGLILDIQVAGNDYVFHVEPCYQVSMFHDNNGKPAPPQRKTLVSNGPMVLRASRFKLVGKQLPDWPKT